jgi:hypothetical protein
MDEFEGAPGLDGIKFVMFKILPEEFCLEFSMK